MSKALPHEAEFQAIGTTCSIIATDATALMPAVGIARTELAALDAAASRFRSDSEISRINAMAQLLTVTSPISDLLQNYLQAALRAAQLTDGLVDPTVGAALIAAGYDADISEVRHAHRATTQAVPCPGWNSIGLTETTLSMPQGCIIDVGSSAKAHAADRIAAALARQLPGNFLVNLGGDIAVSGPQLDSGWDIAVEAADGSYLQIINSQGAAVATSSTKLRTWNTDAGPAHHIINPRTGEVADAVWAQVSVAAATALEANAYSTAAIVLGLEAVGWFNERSVCARLDHADGSVVYTGGWPQEEALAA